MAEKIKYYAKYTKVMRQVLDEPNEETDYWVVQAKSRGLAADIAEFLNSRQESEGKAYGSTGK